MKPLLIAATLALAGAPAFAQAQFVALHGDSAGKVPVQMVVTAEPFRGAQPPLLSAAEVTVFQDRTRLPVTELLPLQGENAGLELYILVDERLDPSQTVLFDQLRRFITSQDPATAVGVAYMFNGDAKVVQAPTKDHALAAQALRASSGSESAEASPYTSLSLLVSRWTAGALRREVFMVTDGMDRFEDTGDYNMYVDDSISDAQRAGVLVYTLYAPAIGHASHSPALIRWGQTYLGQIAEETGGEAYLPSPGTPAPFDQYFADIARHLANQYRITFLATPDTGDGYQRVSFTAEGQNAELVAAHRFYLRASQARP